MTSDTGLLQETIAYSFRDVSLLEQALVHPSFSSEMKWDRTRSNQRLEFLGDAVLELVVSDSLYHMHPQMEEGELTRRRSSLVFEAALNICAKSISLGDFLYLGKGEESMHGREKPSILSDAFEALIGAVYLDGGYDAAESFIRRFVIDRIDELAVMRDGKTLIQEYVQRKPGTSLRYVTSAHDVSDQQHGFCSSLYINDRLIAEGEGHSKKTAEQDAALKAASRLGIAH